MGVCGASLDNFVCKVRIDKGDQGAIVKAHRYAMVIGSFIRRRRFVFRPRGRRSSHCALTNVGKALLMLLRRRLLPDYRSSAVGQPLDIGHIAPIAQSADPG